MPHDTGYVLSNVCLTVTNYLGSVTLAEVCNLLNYQTSTLASLFIFGTNVCRMIFQGVIQKSKRWLKGDVF